ncbi:hypothetical protein ACQY0O_002364 [Thecaphora frezii]
MPTATVAPVATAGPSASTKTSSAPSTTSAPNDVATTLNYCVQDPNVPAYKYVYDPPHGEPKSNIQLQSYPATIHDERPLVPKHNLDDNGFQWMADVHTTPVDFDDADQVRAVYYPEMERLVRSACPDAKRIFIWDHTVRRLTQQPDHMSYLSARGPAMSAHVDQTPDSAMARLYRHLPDEAAELAKSRVRVINVWKPLENAVYHSPLAVCDWQTVQPERDLVYTTRYYPTFSGSAYNVRHSDGHRWYYRSEQRPDECLLIKIFDSKPGAARSTPHSAFEIADVDATRPHRQSIEVRCLVLDAE